MAKTTTEPQGDEEVVASPQPSTAATAAAPSSAEAELEALRRENDLLRELANRPPAATSAADTEPQFVTCRRRVSVHQTPGMIIPGWGYQWTVQANGFTLSAEIPVEDVENGAAAGRWTPDGWSSEETALAYNRRKYRDAFGKDAAANLSADEIDAALQAEDARRFPGGDRPDSIRA